MSSFSNSPFRPSTSLQADASYPVWHPFTPLLGGFPELEVVKAHGSRLHLADGSQLIDGISSWWVNLHGHAKPEIANAIARQALELEHVIFAGFSHKPAVELAKGLLYLANGPYANGKGPYTKVFYSDNGSTATEVALKMALQFWANQGQVKHKVIGMAGAYHGDTFGAMSMAERNAFNEPFARHLFDVVSLDLAPCNDILASLSEEDHHTIEQMEAACASGDMAAFIFEPLVQGSAGMRFYKLALLKELLRIAHQHKVICIADEVMTGFGRTGPALAIHHLADEPTLWPQLVCLSKGITGGFLPLGATLCMAEIQEAFRKPELTATFFHGHSYTANPLACAAALASLDLLNGDVCATQRKELEAGLKVLAARAATWPLAQAVRQVGNILALEWRSPYPTNYFNEVRHHLYHWCLNRGVLLRPLGNVIYLIPPYCLTTSELNQITTVLEELFSDKTMLETMLVEASR